jgi:hypothetical protein
MSFGEENSRVFSPMSNCTTGTGGGGGGAVTTGIAVQPSSTHTSACVSASVSSNTSKREQKKEQKKKKKLLKLQAAVAAARVKQQQLQQMEQNYQRISRQFEAMIAENKTLLVSPRTSITTIDPDLEHDQEHDQQQVESKPPLLVVHSEQDKDLTHTHTHPHTHAETDSLSVREAVLQQQSELLADKRAKMMKHKHEITKLLNESSTLTVAIPRWRHEAAGNKDPTPSLILGGKRLFRVIALMVLHFYAKPILKVRKRRVESKEVLLKEFALSSKLFFDICSGWVGRVVQVPLLSILKVCISFI